MINNDILRRLRYAININDGIVLTCFENGGQTITNEQLQTFYKKEDEEGYHGLNDKLFTAFLDGLIIHYRGKREEKPGAAPRPKVDLNNNEIFKKLRIALQFKDTDIINTLYEAGFIMSKTELNAMFRQKNHKHFKECGDQVLRNFIQGLTLRYRKKKDPAKKKS